MMHAVSEYVLPTLWHANVSGKHCSSCGCLLPELKSEPCNENVEVCFTLS